MGRGRVVAPPPQPPFPPCLQAERQTAMQRAAVDRCARTIQALKEKQAKLTVQQERLRADQAGLEKQLDDAIAEKQRADAKFVEAQKIVLSQTTDGSGEPVTLLSVGRAVPKKGYDLLLRALAALPRDLDWRFVHIGAGSEAVAATMIE